MKILLCQNGSQVKLPIAVPYSQLTLASFIEDVAEVDVSGYKSDGSLPSTDEVMEKVRTLNPDVVGITVNFAFLSNENVDLARSIKEYNPEIKVIAGGHHGTFTADKLLATKYFDAVFLGEGELSLHSFVQSQKFSETPGVMYRDANEIKSTGPTPIIDLDLLKPPAYHLLPKGGLKLAMGIESSRGCPYQCDFCEVRNFFGNRKLRKMSPANFLRNLRHVVDNFGGGYFIVLDDCFTADFDGHVKPICDMLIGEKLPLSLAFTARMDNLLAHMDMIPRLAKAGFKMVTIGVEALFPETLKAMNKLSTYGKEELDKVFRACEDNGIATNTGIVFGYPNETPAMIHETIDQLREAHATAPNLYIATPFPGSNLYDRALKNNEILSSDFRLYDGFHRIISSIPETTPDAVADARRRFFLDRERLAELIINGIESIDMKTILAGAITCSEISDPLRSMPRNETEWNNVFAALAAAANAKSRPSEYSRRVGIRVGAITVVLCFEKGKFHPQETSNGSDCDVILSMSPEVVGDLFIWCRTDLLSAVISGLVTAAARSFEVACETIVELTKILSILRWQGIMKMKVPVLRHTLNAWILGNEERKNRFDYLFRDGVSLTITDEQRRGLVLRFGNRKIMDVQFGTDLSPSQFETTISSDTLSEILHGGLEVLYGCLLNNQIRELPGSAVEETKLVQPEEFFYRLPSKFRPERSENIKVLIHYIIRNKDGEGSWWIRIKDKTIMVSEKSQPGPPDAEIIIDREDFVKMINGIINAMELFTQGEMLYKGSPLIMLELAKCVDDLYGVPEQYQKAMIAKGL